MTTSVVTADELTTNLEAARLRVETCERELASAIIDNRGVKDRTSALDQAKEEVRHLELAIGELGRRETAAENEAATEARRQERISIYRSITDWLPYVERYASARLALTEAEKELEANAPHGVISSLKYLVWTWADRRVADLDKRLIQALPKPPRKGHVETWPDPAKFTPERIAEIAARATKLIEAEERGENIAVTPAEVQQRGTRRRRIRAREARQEAQHV